MIVDNREAFANRERFPEADEIFAEEYEEVFPKLPIRDTSYLVIVTRGHRDDMRVLRWAVGTNAKYIAMIGSKRKVIGVVKELEKEGIPARGLRARFRAHGTGYRRHHAGRNRRFRGGRNDRHAARAGFGLARSVEIHLRQRVAASASQVKP